MNLHLRGKVVLVAAASKGLGRAVALEFAREGASLAICSRSAEAIRATAATIANENNVPVVGIGADLRTENGCGKFVDDALHAFGRIDVLIVNSGGPPPGRFDDLDDGAWQRAVDLTLFSAVRLTRLALPELRKSRGNIVFMTSTSVRQPTQYLNLILSNAIRSAVHGMLKTLSADLAADGIRVNAVQPGRIATDRIAELDRDRAQREGKSIDEVRDEFERTVIPMGRYGEPSEFAANVVFLASDRASYVTGVSLAVDGGMLKSIF